MTSVVSAPLATGRLLLNEPMSRYTSWRVGGKADRLYIPAGLADLRLFLKSTDASQPIYFIGLGSHRRQQHPEEA